MSEALFTENRVVSPFGLLRSTSKYGSSSVAAGETSMLQMIADAGTAKASRPESAPRNTVRFISHLLQVRLQPERQEAWLFNSYVLSTIFSAVNSLKEILEGLPRVGKDRPWASH